MQLANIRDDIQPSELTDLLINYWQLKTDSDLARELGISDRKKVGQYRKRRGTEDIQYRIIVNLMRDIGYLEKKLESQKTAAIPEK